MSPVNAKNEEELKCMVQVAGALGFHSVIGSIQGKLLPVNVTHIETAIPIATKLNIPYSIRISANDDPKVDLSSLHHQFSARNALADIIHRRRAENSQGDHLFS